MRHLLVSKQFSLFFLIDVYNRGERLYFLYGSMSSLVNLICKFELTELGEVSANLFLRAQVLPGFLNCAGWTWFYEEVLILRRLLLETACGY